MFHLKLCILSEDFFKFLLFLSFKNSFLIKNAIKMINNIPKIGEIIIVRVITNEITPSNTVKRGFIKPPVNTEEDPLIVKVAT